MTSRDHDPNRRKSTVEPATPPGEPDATMPAFEGTHGAPPADPSLAATRSIERDGLEVLDATRTSASDAVGPPQALQPAPGRVAPPPPDDPLLGAEIGGCRIDEALGRGAMGAVYRATQLRLDRQVAVKVIRPEFLSDKRMLKRFEIEARTVGRFNSSYVVMVHDVGFERNVHFLVMEFVRGKNLREYVKLQAGGRLKTTEAIPLLRQACKGLEEAQRLGVLHRDIKPDNLMLTDRGVLKIADFGIAKPVTDDFSMTMTSELIGTPLYMSPEQCRASAKLDFRSDMYSLGATFYYLLTGEPPIRASSVYELIETKTKLEHLCLWKALPELDENHPLSRVIERMTALDREDRYGSYEELIADLVVVEQGGAIPAPLPGARRKAVAPARSRRGLIAAAAAVVLLAGGGGYAWYRTRAGQGSAQPAPSYETIAELLTAQREQLGKEGPSERLLAEVDGLVVADAAQDQQRAALRSDLQQGLAAQKRLAAIVPPADVEPPFSDIARHQASVDAALRVEGQVGAELQRWSRRARTEALAERELGAKGRARLAAEWKTWQTRRAEAADVEALAALVQPLDAIAGARKSLAELLPAQAAELETTLPLGAIDAARRSLTEPAAADPATPVVRTDPIDAPAVVDLTQELDAAGEQLLREGPSASLTQRVETMRPSAAEQVRRRNELLDALQLADKQRDLARLAKTTEYPDEPQLPFLDVERYYTTLERALQPLRRDGVLPAWAEALRGELRSEPVLSQRAAATLDRAWTAWRARRAAPDLSADALAKLGTELVLLRGARERLVALFPALATSLDAGVPLGDLARAEGELDRDSKRAQLLAAARATVQRLEGIGAVADWRRDREALEAAVTQQRGDAAAFADDADLRRTLATANGIVERWTGADRTVQAVIAAVAAGDLTGARTAVRGAASTEAAREELRAIETAVARCAEAFELVDRELDLTRALAALADAARALQPCAVIAGEAQARVAAWTQALTDLQRDAAGMVPIPAGRTKAAAAAVPAFFLSATEVTAGEYKRFLDELQAACAAAGAASPAACADALRARLGDALPQPDLLQRMLDRRTKLGAADLPIDNVCWLEAAAFVRWHRLALPTEGEWSLAAFGDGNKYTYPWGNDWSEVDEQRNAGTALAPATRGGRSWRSTDALVLHHLAGNAAEWLSAPAGATEARLAGGRFNDTKSDARRRAAGLDWYQADVRKALPGFGFRTVLRPEQRLGALRPR